MATQAGQRPMSRNIALYPWYKFGQSLLFWQSVWFLFFQEELSGQAAIVLYSVRELSTTLLEVPTGVLSDWIGRRWTLVMAAAATLAGAVFLTFGEAFWAFAIAQILMGAGEAFASGTDNALLYQSLVAAGREPENERQQLRAWRFLFTALAVSAASGGAMAMWDMRLPFLATAIASAALLPLVFWFREPPNAGETKTRGIGAMRAHLQTLGAAFRNPTLLWFLAFSVVMYVFGHLPFVFGQPFILQALADVGLAAEAPAVSGAVTAIMMIVSVGASVFAPALMRRMGTAGILLFAFGLQIWLCLMMALSSQLIVICVLFLRMVPSSLAGPLLLARVHPLLQDNSRATYLSLQSLVGRLVFALALYVAAFGATGVDALSFAEIRAILAVFVAVGVVCLAGLWLGAGGSGVNAGARGRR